MRKIIFSLMFVFLLSLTLVSARVDQVNEIKYAQIEPDASITLTQDPVLNSNIVSYVCSNTACTSYSKTFFDEQPLPVPGSQITLQYPKDLQGKGYALYFYKEGYIPYEVKSNLAGSGNAPSANRYLTKKALCVSNISILEVKNTTSEVTVKARVSSPIDHAGPLTIVPQELESIYSVDVSLSLSSSGAVNSSEEKIINIPYSSSKDVTFTLPKSTGNYNLELVSLPVDEQCIIRQENTQETSLTIEGPVVQIPQIQLTINSPENKTYNTTQILVDISAVNATSVWYSINNGNNITYNQPILQTFQNGTNTLTAYASNSGDFESKSVTFSVILPQNQTNQTNQTLGNILLVIQSPVNTFYNTTKIPVHIITENATSVWYSINNGPNKTYSSIVNETFIEGTNTLDAYASNPFGFFASQRVVLCVYCQNDSDKTPPGQITNLHLVNRTNSSLKWAWTNPLDSDFAYNIIYLDGVNVLNSSTNMYEAIGLMSNSTHTISIKTVDLAGNINQNSVSSTATTLANPAQQISQIELTINSPQNRIYNTTEILVDISAINATSVWYSINNGNNITYNQSILQTFQNGTNTLTAYASNSGDFESKSVTFSVILPQNQTNQTNQTLGNIKLEILSPRNGVEYTYRELTIDISSMNATSVLYSVNNGPNITYSGLTTYIFQKGTNTLTAYASNEFGFNAQDSVSFTVSIDDNGNGGGGSGGSRPRTITTVEPISYGANQTLELDDPYYLNPVVEETQKQFPWLLVLLLALSVLLLLIVFVILLNR